MFTFLLFSCHQQKEKKSLGSSTPLIVEAKGYIVPMESLRKPNVLYIDTNKLKKIAAPKPTIIAFDKSICPVKKPNFSKAGIPKIAIPGQTPYGLPKIRKAIDSSFIAGIPEVVEAKAPYTKDQNPQNFSSYSKLQGLKQQNIYCMLEDKAGNLWFGTNGGGASKFDGKSFTHYSRKEGLSSNVVRCMMEDKKGNIWFGSFNGGLSRFDGISFSRFTTNNGLSNNDIFCMLEDNAGNIWLGTNGGGVCRFDGKNFTNYTDNEGLSNNFVLSILQDKKGNIWFGTNGGGACRFDGKSFAIYTTNEGLSNNNVYSMLEDKSGNIWLATFGGGVSRFDGTSFCNFTTNENLANNMVRAAIEDKNGNLWFGTDGGGVCKFDGESFTRYTSKDGLSSNVIISMLQDSKGNLWFGTYDGGVNRFDGKSFTHFTESEGLSNKHINCIFKDKKGNIWLGSEKGEVNKYDGKTFVQYSLKESFSNKDVLCITEDRKGNLWFGSNGGGLCKFDGKWFSYYTSKDGISYNYIYCLQEDKNGKLWLGTYGEGVYQFNGSSFTHYTSEEGLSNNDVFSIYEDKSGNLWFGTGDGKASKFDGKSFTHFSIKEGFSNNAIRAVFEDKNANLWFGTYGSGVCRFDGKSFIHYTVDDGLSSNNVLSIMEDKNNNLWFGTSFGISKLSVNKLNEIETPLNPNKEVNVIFRNYTYEDGFLGVGVNTGKSLCEDNNGTIWIATNDRLTAYHPQGETSDTIPPNIQLTGIELFNEKINWINLQYKKDTTFQLDNGVSVGDFIFSGISKWNSLPENLSLAYNNNYLTFKFIGITQKSPRKTQYCYKLEGMDENWNTITSLTEAHYGNLPAKTFTFKVKAMNCEGYWSDELQYSFTIRPPWWKTWWAYILYVVSSISAIVFYIKRREKTLKERQKVLEQTVEERTAEVVSEKRIVEKQKAELEIEKRRSDDLLLNILPEEVAEELKQKGSAEARQFDDVTVMFTDFKNFTQITEKLSPSELVAEIHKYFIGFDEIISKYNIEKIKTIGDSYMCAGGLTKNNKTTAIDVLKAALEIREFIKQYLYDTKKEISEPFEIRIGIHTGSVVAGIVGNKKFAYDIWGDTVNIASRMESSGDAGKINISGATYELVKDAFNCSYRGKVPAKNKGEIDMYFVEVRNPEDIPTMQEN